MPAVLGWKLHLIKTESSATQLYSNQEPKLDRGISKRGGTPEDLAQSLAFLAILELC
jgi:hypothetical protein